MSLQIFCQVRCCRVTTASIFLKCLHDNQVEVAAARPGEHLRLRCSVSCNNRCRFLIERSENERQILLLLARGEKEIAQGKGHKLEAILAEADRLLAGAD